MRKIIRGSSRTIEIMVRKMQRIMLRITKIRMIKETIRTKVKMRVVINNRLHLKMIDFVYRS